MRTKLTTLSAALAASTHACLQMNLLNVYNQGSITDYLTKEDELEIRIGVGDDFVFTF